MRMVMCIMANGRMIKLMGLEHMFTWMAQNMLEIGSETSKMDKGRNFGRMERNIKEYIRMVKNKVMVYSYGLIPHNTRDYSAKI